MTVRACWLITAILWLSVATLAVARHNATASATCTKIPFTSVRNDDVQATYANHQWTFDGTAVGYARSEDSPIWSTARCATTKGH